MNYPFVSVILVSYNSKQYLKECLDSLKKQTYKNFEIILVDNDSSDDSVKFVKQNYPFVKIIKNKENLGFAEGNNIGIKEAFKSKKIRYVVCLNVDTKTDKNWLKELVSVAEKNSKIGSVQSKILLYNRPSRINTIGNKINFLGIGYCGGYLELESKYNKIKKIAYASGASVLYSRKALEDVGLFDEDLFMYHEDFDMGWRLMIRGYNNLLAPDSVLYHKYSFLKTPKKIYYAERNKMICNLKDYELKTLLLILPGYLLTEMFLIFFAFKEGFFLEKLTAYEDFLLTVKETLRKRKVIQKNRKVNDKELTKIFTAKIEFEEVNSSLLNKLANPLMEIYWHTIRRML
jgi:GT2 family glycosyltransferase